MTAPATTAERCAMCEQAPATTRWGLPVCQPCRDGLVWLDGELQALEDADPKLAAAGARLRDLEAFLRGEFSRYELHERSVRRQRAARMRWRTAAIEPPADDRMEATR